MKEIFELYLREKLESEELISFIKRKYNCNSALDYLCEKFGYKNRIEAYESNLEYFNPPLMNLED